MLFIVLKMFTYELFLAMAKKEQCSIFTCRAGQFIKKINQNKHLEPVTDSSNHVTKVSKTHHLIN